jgi:hypothetical protein
MKETISPQLYSLFRLKAIGWDSCGVYAVAASILDYLCVYISVLKRELFLPKNLVRRRHILIEDDKTTERKTAKPVFL